jgi:cytoskeletal protein CcmA (bactofilin family)
MTKAAELAKIVDASGNVVTSGTVEPAGDTAAGDNAAIGFTSAEGIVITGQGSTNDVTIKNDVDADVIEIPTGTTNVTVAGTLTATGFIIGSADINENDLESIDGITAGTIAASKAAIVDTNKDITGFRNITLTGELDAATLDISGDADIDGTLEADAITVNGTALATVIAGTTVTTATNANHVSVADNESTNEENLIPFIEDTSATGNVGLESDGDFAYNPSTGTVSATVFKGNIDAVDGDFDGTLEADAITIGGTAIASVLSPVAGSSSIVTTGALNSGSITSGFGTIDTGSSTITTTGAITGGSLVADNITIDGTEIDLSSGNLTIDVAGKIILDADSTGSVEFHDGGTKYGTISTVSNHMYITSAISDADIIFQGNDGGSGIAPLTLDMSDAGTAIFNHDVKITSGNIQFGASGSETGQIEINSSRLLQRSTGDASGLRFDGSAYTPFKNGSAADGTVDIGSTGARYKDLFLSSGIFLGGTGSANELDDYEEGTWTPTLFNGSSALGSADINATYTKIGRMVYLEFRIQRDDTSSDTNTIQIGGLPFTSRNGFRMAGQAWIDNSSSDIRCFIYLGASTTTATLIKAGDTDSFPSLNELTHARYIVGQIIYNT